MSPFDQVVWALEGGWGAIDFERALPYNSGTSVQKWLKYKVRSLENDWHPPYSLNPWAELAHFFWREAPRQFLNFVFEAEI